MRRPVVGALAAFAVIACVSAAPAPVTLPAPADSISIASLAPRAAVAVLSGTLRAKTLSIIDLRSRHVVRAFGVEREAQQLASTATRDGDLLVALASPDGSVGAISRWSLDGRHLGSIAMPAGAIDVTIGGDGTGYALVARDRARSAIPFDPRRGAKPAIALPGATTSISWCRAHGRPVLVTSDTTYRHLTLIALPGGRLTVLPTTLDDPICDGDGQVAAFKGSLDAMALVRYSIDRRSELASGPTDGAATDLAADGRGDVYVLSDWGPQASIAVAHAPR